MIYTGQDTLRKIYADLFQANPQLNCKIVNRIVIGTKVIDHEEITGLAKDPAKKMYGVAIYKVENDLIAKVYFLH